MTTNVCNSLYTDPALTYVDLGMATFIPIATQAFALAQEQVSAVTNFEVPFHTWNAEFDAVGDLVPIIRPTRPALSNITPPPEYSIPDTPNLAIAPVVLDVAPAEPAELSNIPVFSPPPTPSELDAERPGDAPEMNLPTMPDAPVYVEPEAPVLIDIVLPEAPDIEIVPFAEEAPEFDAAIPNDVINFTESLYASDLLNRLREQITAGIDGTFYLPAAVANALWDTAVQREDQSSLKLMQEGRDLHAANGFDEPNGVLNKRLMEIEYQNRGKRAELNRQTYVREEEVALENLRFFVQQGMALETTLLQAHLTIEQRKFDLASKTKDVQIAIFNAHVAQYNAAVNVFNARVDAYRAFIDGQRAEIDIYRAQIEGAKAVGEINVQRTQVYTEQVRSQLARAEIYRAQIEGGRALIEAERAKIEGFREEVNAYVAQVQAHGAEWEAYRTQVMAQAEQGRMYSVLADVYSTRVDVWKTKSQTKFATQEADLKVAEAFLRQHDNQVKTIAVRLDAHRALMAAQTAQNEAVARMYQADTTVEATVSEANARAFQAETERSRVHSEILLRDASMQIQQLNSRTGLLLEALKTGASASSQLAASSLSAFSIGANVSSSQQRSKACQTSFSYSGEIADAGL